MGYVIDCDAGKVSKYFKIACILPAYCMELVNNPFMHFSSSYLRIMKIILAW
jgi:hypothetical protein